jgi:hypothetical protein
MLGELSCMTFSKGWGLDSGMLTPQEASTADLDYSSTGVCLGGGAARQLVVLQHSLGG